MAIITDATFEWSTPVVLANNEIWQARGAYLIITTTTEPDAEDGLSLRDHEAIHLSAGSTVQYRKEGTGRLRIIREVV